MSAPDDEILESPPYDPDADFWKEQGRKLVEQSLPAVREAAKSLMTALGFLQSVYMGILGFSNYLPKTLSAGEKLFYILPLLLWIGSLFYSLRVITTEESHVNINSPDDIRNDLARTLQEKQANLNTSFMLLAAGIVLAVVLLLLNARG